MKKTLIIFILSSFCVLGVQCQTKGKPNILLIYTDDHRYTGIQALGGKGLHTPHMDELVEQGVTFTKTYLQGAFTGATCIPSRAMLLTGKNLFELDGQGHNIPEDHTMIGEAFSKAGYHTHREGKWHQDFKSLSRGFHSGGWVMGKPVYLTDHFRMPFSEWNAEGEYTKEKAFLLTWTEEGGYEKRALTKDDKKGPTGTELDGPHSSVVIADGTIDFINSYKEQNPFLVYAAFHAPHDPRQSPKKFKEMYPPEEVTLPPSYLPQHSFDNGHFYTRDERLAAWPRTEEVARSELADYYAIITHLDQQIGRVIEALKQSGQYENTIIILAGDSGLAVGNHGLMGKQNLYDEDGIHVPFIISGGFLDKSQRGKKVHSLSYIHDIFPTLCDVAGVSMPSSISGKSLAKVISGEVREVRNEAYYAYRQHQRAYREGDYKLIEYVRAPDNDWKRGKLIAGSRVTQLFNLKDDPWETFNLADFPEYEKKIAELRLKMQNAAEEVGDIADGKRTKFDFWEYY
ncbi:MAG: sulfatase-like hydrolase/transferase [Bacteroidota bacterium]